MNSLFIEGKIASGAAYAPDFNRANGYAFHLSELPKHSDRKYCDGHNPFQVYVFVPPGHIAVMVASYEVGTVVIVEGCIEGGRGLFRILARQVSVVRPEEKD